MKSVALDAMKIAPSGAYVAATIGGLSINEWAALAALLYSAGMLALLVWDRGIKPWRLRRKAAAKSAARRARRIAVRRLLSQKAAGTPDDDHQ